MLPWRWASHTFSNWSWSWLRERKEEKKKNRSSSPIGWWITPEHQTAARRTTACVQPIPVLSSTDTRAWKTIGQGKFGSLFSPPMMHWGRLGWVWRCSESSSSQLCSRADVTAGGKGKKKNRSNYSSNYLIISLCGGEQEGGWRRALCFLSPSALPSWWALSSEVFTFLLCLCRFHCDSHPPLYLSFDLQHKHENQQERREGGAGVWKC